MCGGGGGINISWGMYFCYSEIIRLKPAPRLLKSYSTVNTKNRPLSQTCYSLEKVKCNFLEDKHFGVLVFCIYVSLTS